MRVFGISFYLILALFNNSLRILKINASLVLARKIYATLLSNADDDALELVDEFDDIMFVGI
jgi:hypothetical protein